MACTSLIALPRVCDSQGAISGLEKLYMISIADLAVVSGSTEYYTTATNGIVNEIGLETSKKFVEIGLLKNTAGIQEQLTKDVTKGVAFLTQTMTMAVSDLSVENKTWIENVMNQPVAALVKSRSGKYYVIGLNGQFELTGLEGGTGTAEADLSGYTLTFSGVSKSLMPQVDSTILSDII